MAHGAGKNLPGGRAALCQANGVIRSGKVAGDCRTPLAWVQFGHGAAQELGLTGARPADKVDGQDVVGGKAGAQISRQPVIIGQDILANL
jgi:hypothetical protein